MNETESAVEQVLSYLENRQYHALRQYLENEEAADVAGWFLEIPREYFLLLFRILPKELAAEVFVELEPDVQETLLKAFSDEELGQVVERLFVDDTVELIEEMPANVVHRIIANTTPEKRSAVNALLQYPRDSAGSGMTTEFVELKTQMTAADVFKNINRSGIDRETIYDCYVTDQSRRLIGVLSIKDLLITKAENPTVGELMQPEQDPLRARDIVGIGDFDVLAAAVHELDGKTEPFHQCAVVRGGKMILFGGIGSRAVHIGKEGLRSFYKPDPISVQCFHHKALFIHPLHCIDRFFRTSRRAMDLRLVQYGCDHLRGDKTTRGIVDGNKIRVWIHGIKSALCRNLPCIAAGHDRFQLGHTGIPQERGTDIPIPLSGHNDDLIDPVAPLEGKRAPDNHRDTAAHGEMLSVFIAKTHPVSSCQYNRRVEFLWRMLSA